MTNKRTCPICGKEFETSSTAKVCSAECRKKNLSRLQKDFHKRKAEQNEAEQEKARLKAMSTREIANAAFAEGLSYGQYVAKYGL